MIRSTRECHLDLALRTTGAASAYSSEAETAMPNEAPSSIIVTNFIHKFDLLETQTRLLMSKLTPVKRWEIIKTFHPESGVPVMTTFKAAVSNAMKKEPASKVPGRVPPSGQVACRHTAAANHSKQ